MLRFVVILLAAILLISFLRSIIGLLIKGFAAVINTNGPSPATSRQAAVPSSSELKKDPVCGTYVPVATSVKKTVAGSVVHFCSTDCRDKYPG